MEAVAVQRKEREKSAKPDVKATPEVSAPAFAETGAAVGMPLFLQAGSGARIAAVPPSPPSPRSSPLVQRMCEECAEELAGKKRPLQRAVTIGAVDDPLEREANAVADHVLRKAAGAPTVQRKGVGPMPMQRLCKRCSSELNEPTTPVVRRRSFTPGVQRLCNKCAAELEQVQPKSNGDSGAGAASNNVSSLIASPGSGSPLSQSVRERTEPVLNADLSGVRVHSDARAQSAAADINAKAFTHGNNIFLGAGQSLDDLGLMAHELTHTVQQGASPTLQRKPSDDAVSVSPRLDANHIQRFDLPSVDDVVGTLSDIGDAVSDAAESVVETGEELVEGAVEVAEEAAETVQGIAREVWDTANAIASAIGGMVSFSGGRLTISVPAFNACPTIPLQFTLPTQDIFIPVVEGAVPVHPLLSIYGAIGVNAVITPELSVQLGPCRVHGLHIVIDPLRDYYGAAGWITVTTALGLGAEVSVGARGEVGVIVILPTAPPIPLQIPVAGLEAGIAAQARAIAAGTVDLKAAASYSGGVFSGALRAENDVGLALDWGLGGYGQLDVLGHNLCRLYWPLYEGHWDTGMHYEVNAAMTISSSGFAVALSIGGFRPIPFSSIPVELNRDVLSDDCVVKDALCAILYALGWMPSQNGGSWTGHPEPYWPGPLDVYPRSPAIASGHSCRGACGPNCDTCTPPINKVHCLPRPAADGGEGQDLLVYPNYQECDTHAGCREHDACYDWCAASSGGPSGVGPFLCRRLCDFECLCAYPPHQCIGWIFGAEPHDGKMLYSDEPRITPGCDIPCPEEGEDADESGGGYTVCLPTLELFEELSDGDSWPFESDEYSVWKKDIIVPYVGLVTLELNASAGAEAAIHGSLGPGTMENICFDVDPLAGHYVARGEIQIPARLSGSLTLRARLSADASWFRVVKVASAIGTLSATGEAVGRANLNPTLRAQVEVDCDGGLKPSLITDINFPRCLNLSFDLNAGFDLEALTFNIYSHTWNLAHAEWGRCWGENIDIDAHSGREPDLDLRSIRISIPDLIRWLLSDEAEQEDEEPDTTRTVVEDPLTTATAKTIGTISGDLNRTTYNSSSLTVGGSSATVGASMMTRYLTHEKTGGGPPSGQDALYGFRKLPTKSAHSGTYSLPQVYIRGHLLNEGLGGIGQPQNLYPITGRANKDHEIGPEKDVKRLVRNNGLVAMYGVTVVNQNGPHPIEVFGDGTCTYHYINAGFSCTYATYKLYSDDSVELNTPTTTPVPSSFDVSGFISRVSSNGCTKK